MLTKHRVIDTQETYEPTAQDKFRACDAARNEAAKCITVADPCSCKLRGCDRGSVCRLGHPTQAAYEAAYTVRTHHEPGTLPRPVRGPK